jgi:hypothetical protein
LQFFWLYPLWQVAKMFPEEYRRYLMILAFLVYTFYM